MILMLLAALVAGGCTDDGLCGEGAGESSVEVDASALARSGSQLKVCINDACNDAADTSSTRVSVHYAPGVHPDFARWTVQRVTGGSWEGLAGGEVGLACTRGRSAVRIVVDANGEATITGASPDP